MQDPWHLLAFLAHTIALGGFASIGFKLQAYRKTNGPLLLGLIRVFFGAGLFWAWIWIGYLERLSDFWPGVDLLSEVTRRFVAVPIAAFLFWPLWKLSSFLERGDGEGG